MINLAIISTNQNKYSETFIHNHVKLLQGNIHFLFDGYLPGRYYNKSLNKYGSISEYTKTSWFSSLFAKPAPDKENRMSDIEHYLIKHKINCILCEYGPSGVELMTIAERLNIPLIVHFHGYDAYRDDILNSYGKQYPELFRIAGAIIVVSKHMHARLMQLGCPETKIHYLPYGIDTNNFRYTERKIQQPVFVACGRFVEKKAPHITIEAFAKLLPEHPEARLIMIGDGELLDTCRQLVEKNHLSKSVEFKGVLSPDQVSELFKHATAFVQHSVTSAQNDSEGTPLTIMEAMASGLPVVATKHGGITDIITDGQTGYLVNEKDVEAMAHRMKHIIGHPEESNAIGLNASRYIQQQHTIGFYTNQLNTLINTCVEKINTGKN